MPLKEIVGELPKASIVRSSFGSAAQFNDLDKQIADETMNIVRRESLVPAIKDRVFKLKTYSKHSKQQKRKIEVADTVSEEFKDIALAESIGKDLVLQELIAKETLLLAVSSSTYQNLSNHVNKNVLPKT